MGEGLILKQAESIAIEYHTIDCIIEKGDGDCALLYLYLLKTGGNISIYAASEALKRPTSWVSDTLKKLEQMNLLLKQKKPQQTEAIASTYEGPPAYTAEEIAKEMEGHSPFPDLVQDTQRRIGRVLSTTDLKILFGLYDYLDLPVEVISLLITYCMEETGRQSGGKERPLRMRQVEREAYRWKRLSVDTLERAETYLKEMETRRTLYAELFEVFQLPLRAPSPSERKYIDEWLDMGFSVDAIALAYDKTMLQTGSLKWPYLNSILKRWHQKNLHTLGEIKAGDGKSQYNRSVKATGDQKEASLQAEQESIEWMKELVRKQKQDD